MKRPCVLPLLLLLMLQPAVAAGADATQSEVQAMLERECTHLDKGKLMTLLAVRFPDEMAGTVPPDLLKIMEGVVKRTDFDTITEEKTAEIVAVVYSAFRQGAPLEQLDKIFDVAYAKPVTPDRLAAAAKALRDLGASEVPEVVYEEFVYRSLEDEWDPAALPVLTRGLIYATERGLTPQRTALVMMLDVRNGELKKKTADQIVLDAITLVRGREPKNWKPMKPSERELAARKEEKRRLEERRKQTEEKRRQSLAERSRREEELKRLRQPDAGLAPAVAADVKRRRAEHERITRELDAMIAGYQQDLVSNRRDQDAAEAAVRKQAAELEREKEAGLREREDLRRKEFENMQLDVLRYARTTRLNPVLLQSSVDRYLGTPYRYGGDSEAGLDCSAFTRKIYRDQGIELPRTARDQSRVGTGMPPGDPFDAGDLVFFDPSIVGSISHVGVYLGGNVFAHASSSRGVVKSSLRERYYQKRFVQANRILTQ